MQYFLKAALGPNLNLNRIFVFDPIFSQQSIEAKSMRDRYESCFAPQLRKQIVFLGHGTDVFVNQLANAPSDLLF